MEVAATAVDMSSEGEDGGGAAGTRQRTAEGAGGAVGGTEEGAGATAGTSAGGKAEAAAAAPEAGMRGGGRGKGVGAAAAPPTGEEKAGEAAGGALPAEGAGLLEAGRATSVEGMAGRLGRGPPNLAVAVAGRRWRGGLRGGEARSGTSMMTTRCLEGRKRVGRAESGWGRRGRLLRRTG